jgi:adenosylcobinamide amidohydrolase
VTIVATSSASIAFSGTASDNVAVAAVKWTTSTGYSGTASGTSKWSASVPLLVGNNVITIRAYDAAGNSSWRAITVVRQ